MILLKHIDGFFAQRKGTPSNVVREVRMRAKNCSSDIGISGDEIAAIFADTDLESEFLQYLQSPAVRRDVLATLTAKHEDTQG